MFTVCCVVIRCFVLSGCERNSDRGQHRSRDQEMKALGPLAVAEQDQKLRLVVSMHTDLTLISLYRVSRSVEPVI
jgi:hypothetical protein